MTSFANGRFARWWIRVDEKYFLPCLLRKYDKTRLQVEEKLALHIQDKMQEQHVQIENMTNRIIEKRRTSINLPHTTGALASDLILPEHSKLFDRNMSI